MVTKDTAKVVGAVLLGTLIGAGIGILFAPDKGSNTRKKIVDGAKGVADNLKQKVKDETELLERMAEEKLHKMRAGEDGKHAV
jgi:gas vesicle protein